ncbi:hypothetical protein GGI35DRAFT_451656 [Trichoderma velutinum]
MNDGMAWHGMARLDPLPAEEAPVFSSSATSFIRTSDRMPAWPCRRGMDLYLYVDRSSMSPPTDTFRSPTDIVVSDLIFFCHDHPGVVIPILHILFLALCPEQAPPFPTTSLSVATHPSIHCGTKFSLFGNRRCSCSGCGSGETNDIRASPDHMADRPCSLLERVVENDLGFKKERKRIERLCDSHQTLVAPTPRSRAIVSPPNTRPRLGSFTLLLARRGLDFVQFTEGSIPYG